MKERDIKDIKDAAEQVGNMIDFAGVEIGNAEMENLAREICREILNRANVEVAPNRCPLCER